MGFSRAADVDAYAVESQKRAAQAWKEGRFKKSITPVKDQLGLPILDHDEHMRPETTMQTLAALEPSFKMQGEQMPGFDAVALQRYPEIEEVNHVHHAGNSSGIVDGAAAVLIGTKELGDRDGVEARAQRFVGGTSIGSEPSIMLTGPGIRHQQAAESPQDDEQGYRSLGTQRGVRRRRAALDQRHRARSCKGQRQRRRDRDGHPLGATGAMILGTMVDELERSNKERALITLCVGAGMGTATVIERV